MLSGSVAALLLSGTPLSGTAQADTLPPPTPPTVVACGATITQNTTLAADVGPCPRDGMVVSGSNITIDLNDHKVFAVNGSGDNRVGVRMLSVTGVTLRHGTVDGFNGGVVIQNGSGNTVEEISATNNISDYGGGTKPSCDNGDGIAIFDSSNNLIKGNVANHNGPYGGISIVNNSDGNQIIGNTTSDNNVASPSGAKHPACIDNEQQDEGIRVEGPGADNTMIKGNIVDNNLLAGIGIHAANNIDPSPTPILPNTFTSIINNDVHFNGNSATDNSASGISILGTPGVRAFNTTITGNESSDNKANGIYLPAKSHDNVVEKNIVDRNGKDGIFVAGPTFSNKFTNVGPTQFNQTSPGLPDFVLGTDYSVLSGSGSGNPTARLVPVGPINVSATIPFDSGASGCLPSDFVGFPSGAIALVQRGFCGRADKVTNAKAAGAVGVVMFNEGSTGRTALLTAGVDVTTIPVLGTTFALGKQLYNATQAGPVTVHITTNTTNVSTQTGPGAENNTLTKNTGHDNVGHDAVDSNVAPPCDNNKWTYNNFGTVNQACVATLGHGDITA